MTEQYRPPEENKSSKYGIKKLIEGTKEAVFASRGELERIGKDSPGIITGLKNFSNIYKTSTVDQEESPWTPKFNQEFTENTNKTSFQLGGVLGNHLLRLQFESHASTLPIIPQTELTTIFNVYNHDIFQKTTKEYNGNLDDYFVNEQANLVKDLESRIDINILAKHFSQAGILNTFRLTAGACYMFGLYKRYAEIEDLNNML